MNILLVLSEYAISSSSDDPITRKWPKNLACAYLDHPKRHFWWILNNPTRVITWTSHGDYLVQSEYAVSSKSDAPKSRKWPKTVFGCLDHSKRHFWGFWMIHYDWYNCQIMQTIWFYHDMQYQVNPMHRTCEITKT